MKQLPHLGTPLCAGSKHDASITVTCFLFCFFSSPPPPAHRYQQSSKSSSHPSTLQPGAKSESLREEMEETANRMEICRVSHRPQPLQHCSLLQLPFLSPFDLCFSCACQTQMGHGARLPYQQDDVGEMVSNGTVSPFSVSGSALSRYVQLCGQRNRLCKLLSDCKFLYCFLPL